MEGWGSFDWLEALDALVALVAAYVLALPLAIEREVRTETNIGIRTVPLVAVGACAYVLLSRHLREVDVYTSDGVARTLRAVMTGIGFIGGGAILKQGRDIIGIATGAAVWTAGAIGAAVGQGYYEIAIVLAVATVLVLELPRWFGRRARDAEGEAS